MAATTTREKLLESAQKLFHEKGYANTGTAEILRASGAGAGSLYHFFAGKEELLLALLDRLVERLERQILARARAHEDPVEQVLAVLGFYRDFLQGTGCRLGCPVGNLAGELADTHPRVREKLAELFAAWRGGVRESLLRARDRLPASVDPESLSVFVLSVMEGGVMQARVERSLRPFDLSVGVLRDYFHRILPPTQE